MKNPFRMLTRFEWALWLFSMSAILASAAVAGFRDPLSTLASLVGVTGLIFLAKGAWQGQVFIILFAIIYGIVSLRVRYYGEMITYVGMSLPMAVVSLVAWLRNPFEGKSEVRVARLTWRRVLLLAVADVAVTVAFYFILGALGTSRVLVSTVSVMTSFAAAMLTFLRSPYFALAYATNDVVLVVLWILAAIKDLSCLPMTVCFAVFLANDLYSFINWRKMEKRQNGAK